MNFYKLVLLSCISSLVGCFGGSSGSGSSFVIPEPSTHSVYYFSGSNSAMTATQDLMKYDSLSDLVSIVDKPNDSGSSNVIIFNQKSNHIYYTAFNGVANTGYHVYRMDTVTGEKTDLYPSGFGGLYTPKLFGTDYYFACNTVQYGQEMCKLDSNDVITVLDFIPGSSSYSLTDIMVTGDYLFFQANDGIHGSELYMHDPLLDSFSMIQDLTVGAGNSVWQKMFVVNDKYYGIASQNGGVEQLFYLDDNAIGDPLVNLTLALTPRGVIPTILIKENNVYFFAFSGEDVINIYKLNTVDNSITKQTSFTDNQTSGFGFVEVGNYVYISANDGVHGPELVKVDLTNSGCSSGNCSYSIIDINNGSSGSTPMTPKKIANKLYFSANDGSHGMEVVELNLDTDLFSVHDVRKGPQGSYSHVYGLYESEFLLCGNRGFGGNEVISINLNNDNTINYLDGCFDDIRSIVPRVNVTN